VYTGNPIACSASLATLSIFEKENVLEKNLKKSRHIAKSLERFRELDRVENIRGVGMIFAFDIKGYSLERELD